MDPMNRQVRLAARPIGMPRRADWRYTEEAVPEPQPGEILVEVLYVSIDPAMRGWMNDGRSYLPPVGIGEVMRAGGIGRVLASKHPGIAVDDYVSGMFGVQEYARTNGAGVTAVDPRIAPLPVHLGALGMTGMTAYFGLLDVGRPQSGQTVVVSAAAGAVGSVAGQIAKIMGCRAVGIAGGEAKCRYIVEELGFDAAVDYKAGDVRQGLRAQCPNGIDVYFDNVGGAVLDAALACLARHARVVICGAVSQYNSTVAMRGPSNYMSLLVNRASMTGFLVFDYAARYPEAARALTGWRAEGTLKSREEIVDGLTNFPDALIKLLLGENTGKLVLKLADR
jgi:NADPH-dependent curcumin reductase CurA